VWEEEEEEEVEVEEGGKSYLEESPEISKTISCRF